MDVVMYDVALVPATMGLVEVLKKAGLNSKYAPIASVIIGLVFGVVVNLDSLLEGIIVGIGIGLAAAGLYSGTKALTREVEK